MGIVIWSVDFYQNFHSRRSIVTPPANTSPDTIPADCQPNAPSPYRKLLRHTGRQFDRAAMSCRHSYRRPSAEDFASLATVSRPLASVHNTSMENSQYDPNIFPSTNPDRMYLSPLLWCQPSNLIRLDDAPWSCIILRINWSVEDDELSAKKNRIKIIKIGQIFLRANQNMCRLPLNFVQAMSMAMYWPTISFSQLHRAIQPKPSANFDCIQDVELSMDSVALHKFNWKRNEKIKIGFWVPEHNEQWQKLMISDLTMQPTAIRWRRIVI